jgi:hypothetical protein
MQASLSPRDFPQRFTDRRVRRPRRTGPSALALAVLTLLGDPVTNTWTTKASMPTARWNLAAASANGILYAFGGLGSTDGYTKNEAYTP